VQSSAIFRVVLFWRLPQQTYGALSSSRYFSDMKITANYMHWLMKRKREAARNAPRGFFTRRGNLALARDSSAHRRYSYLYEDMLE